MSTDETEVSDVSDRRYRLDLDKWEVEKTLREREIGLKERDQVTREAELVLKRAEHDSSHWRSPLIVAIFAATVAGLGNAVVAYTSASAQRRLEADRSEQARILEVIKTGNPDKAAENLRFLLDAGLIADPGVRTALLQYLSSRKPGSGPVLPSPAVSKDLSELVSRFEGTILKPYKDPLGKLTIGSGHTLTTEEVASGKVVIDGRDVDFQNGITDQQAKQLLAADLSKVGLEVDRLVTVKLTSSQRDSLISFVFQVGLHTFRGSTLLKKINAGQFEDVPAQMRKWVMVNGEQLPRLVQRRESELEIWRKQ